jgi:hypothetical protein
MSESPERLQPAPQAQPAAQHPPDAEGGAAAACVPPTTGTARNARRIAVLPQAVHVGDSPASFCANVARSSITELQSIQTYS